MPVSTEKMPASTADVIKSHLEAAREGVNAVMQHFTDESIVITREATYRGLAEIRQFYTTFFNRLPKGFFDAFKMNRLESVGEIGYIHWQVEPCILSPPIHSWSETERSCFRRLLSTPDRNDNRAPAICQTFQFPPVHPALWTASLRIPGSRRGRNAVMRGLVVCSHCHARAMRCGRSRRSRDSPAPADGGSSHSSRRD